MKTDILSIINKKSDYMMALDVATGAKTSFTDQEKSELLAVYADNAKNKFGFDDETLVKAVLALDAPGANLLDKPDAAALAALSDLCKDWELKPEKAAAVKDSALSEDVSQPLALALARAALDAYAGQNDLTEYREEIKALSAFLSLADEKMFSDASAFLIRVRERVRTR